MAYDPVAMRYAQAVFETAKADGRLDEAREQMVSLGALLTQHPQLGELMMNPDVDPQEKIGLLDRVLRGAWSELVKATIRMVVELGRSESLPQIVEAFDALADDERGQVRATVRSARPVGEALLERVKAHLAAREGKQVILTTELDPQLLGGLQVLVGHRLIDGSIRRQLDELRSQLKTVRVA